MADTLSCQWETLHSQQLRSIKKSIDSDHGIYRYCEGRFKNETSRLLTPSPHVVASLSEFVSLANGPPFPRQRPGMRALKRSSWLY